MHFSLLLTACACVGSVVARAPAGRHVPRNVDDSHGHGDPNWGAKSWPPNPTYGSAHPSWPHPTAKPSIIPQNSNTTKFKVDGTKIPDVNFDVGESYAGLLPISDEPNVSELYFWFFPSANELAGDEILIWLNGGPGCSSLEGLLQENGPFLWQYGTYRPVRNAWSWTNLTNVLWVEQPAGTGFSPKKGTPTADNEIEVAEQFLGFFKNFMDTFGLQGRKVYITGESYAGYFVPYIADAMHNSTDKDHFNIESIMIYDPSVNNAVVQQDIPAVPFFEHWSGLFNLNDSYSRYLHQQHEACGFEAFLAESLVYPPKGPLPSPPSNADPNCQLLDLVLNAVSLVNPCFDIYQVATTCPLLWDVLGYPGSFPYLPDGTTIYFNRTDVQKAINAPVQPWDECSDAVLMPDNSPPSGLSVLPRVIEKNNRTIIAHGTLDMVLILNGTLVTIQNMTFNGAQGFSVPPSQWNDFYVPYHEDDDLMTLAGAGILGKWHTERGLTFSTVDLSGHMIPQLRLARHTDSSSSCWAELPAWAKSQISRQRKEILEMSTDQ